MPHSSLDSVIAAKLHPPDAPEDAIARTALCTAFPVGARGDATLVCAPAGYGKSSFVMESASASERHLAWLSLDAADNDLRRFLLYVCAAIDRSGAGACTELLNSIVLPTLPAPEKLGEILAHDVESLDEAITLVLDDYQQISDPAIHELVSALLLRPPRNLHAVIVSRRDPPLPMQVLRARGRLMEVRAQRLAFTSDEALLFLQHGMGRTVSAAWVLRVNTITEGWPAGLRLAGLAVEDAARAEDLVGRMPQGTSEARDYLLHEVLRSCAPPLRRYLLLMSFLDRFCAPLCDAVVAELEDPDEIQVLSGDAFVRQARSSGLFTIALDGRGDWFRFHHLFQWMLQQEARAHFTPEQLLRLHRRAAGWLVERKLYDEAIQQLLFAEQPEEAAELIIRHRHAIMGREQWHELDGWLRRLPDELAERRPELLLLRARWLRTAGSRTEMEAVLQRAEALMRTVKLSEDVERELRGSMESLRCYELYMQGQGERSLASARRALELLPTEDLAERGFAYIMLAGSLHMLGRLSEAKAVLQAALVAPAGLGEVPPVLRTRILAAHGFLFLMQGEPTALQSMGREVLRTGREAGLSEITVVGLHLEAAAHYERNELVAARDVLAGSLGGRTIGNAEYEAQNLIVDGLAQQELGDASGALHAVRRVRELALAVGNASLQSFAAAFAADVALRQGHIAEAMEWAMGYEAEPFTPPHAEFWPTLVQARILIADGSRRSLKRAARLLDGYVTFAECVHHRRALVEALATRALLRFDTDEQAGRADLERAIVLAEPGRSIRLFLDLGPRLGRLLNSLDLEGDRLRYVGEILAAFREQGREDAAPREQTAVGDTSGIDALSKREVQVLRLMAQRLSNKEIGEKLFISDVTVKRHTANIYEKLGVHGRQQAVAKALGLGILSGSGDAA
ncbi:MAG: LuxR C-terminal-related transcriptional regulator [Pseudomonadales bacterium]|jgi:LuxR family maltose regulon positive regulatory protein|nr:LuxR C-terminal-related transcriptional regulator [Pseudomonadales bacterium]